MEFLNIAILSGLAVAAIPIIIHLLNRRKARVIDWGAMRFLEQSLASRSRRIMIEELLLLLLRTALLAVLVAAMARPLMKNPYFAGAGQASQDVVIVLDGSMSMGLAAAGEKEGREDAGTRGRGEEGKTGANYFGLARKAATELIDRLAAGDAVSIVLASAEPRRLTELTYDKEAAKSAMAVAGLADGVMDVTGSLALAGKVLQGGQNAHKQIFVITDGRAHGWALDAAESWQTLAEKFASYARSPHVQVLALAGGLERPGLSAGRINNLSVESAGLSRPVVGTDLPVIVTVVVRNTGQTPVPAGVRLLLRAAPGAEPVDVQPLAELAPMAQAAAQLVIHFAEPGAYRLVIEAEYPDALANDNLLTLAVEVLRDLPVLIVNGAPSDQRDKRACYWLDAALQPAHSPDEQPIQFLVRPTVIEPALAGNENLNDYSAVVLADVARLDGEAVRRLTDYVRGGGGLLLAPGARADLDFYNGALYDDGRGILPARLLAAKDLLPADQAVRGAVPLTTRPEGQSSPRGSALKGEGEQRPEAVQIVPPPQGHPALFRSGDPALWTLIRVLRHYPLAPDERSGQVASLLQLSNGELFGVEGRVGSRAGGPAGSLRDGEPAGSPENLSHRSGEGRGGRVILLGGPLDASWSSVPLHTGYVILANELIYHLSAGRRMRLNLAPGEVLQATEPLDSVGESPAAELRRPDGRTFAVPGVTEKGRCVFRSHQTAEPGVYELKFIRPTGGTAQTPAPAATRFKKPPRQTGKQDKPDRPDVLYFTVQRDPGESFTALLDAGGRQRVSQWLGGAGFYDEPRAVLDCLRITDPGREIWKLLACGVLGMLLMEVWLTRRITRRRKGAIGAGVKFGAEVAPVARR